LDIESLRQEHAALQALRAELLALVVDAPSPHADLAGLRWRFSRVLLAHLAREDRHLYPRMKADPERETAALAIAYEQEMGGLAACWQAYMTDWPGTRIAREWPAFRARTVEILDLLALRIEREERDLYPRLAAPRPRPFSPG